MGFVLIVRAASILLRSPEVQASNASSTTTHLPNLRTLALIKMTFPLAMIYRFRFRNRHQRSELQHECCWHTPEAAQALS